MNAIEYKYLKEGDTITCEAAGYADFKVGGRYEAKKDDNGLYLTCSGFERPYYLHEMFKYLDDKPEVVYYMCRGGFLFYKKLDKDGTKPFKIDESVTLPKLTLIDFTEEELKRYYDGMEKLRQQIKLDRNKDKIKVGEFWKYRPKEFQIVGVEEGDEGIESILIEDTKNSEYLQWVDMPDFLEHYEPCNPPDIVIHVDADKVNKFCK